MPNRFTQDELVDKALLALKEVAETISARPGPVAPTRALRFTLAFLAQGHDRKPYDMFWKAATEPMRGGEHHHGGSIHFGRVQTVNNLGGFICRLHNREPW
jgi:hypothetical protein